MFKILIPVDGSASSEKAARHVVDMAGVVGALEVHLLYVHPPVDDWEVKRFLREKEIDALVAGQGEEAMQAAGAILEAAGIHPGRHIAVGEVAQTIADNVAACGCNQIVMGARGRSALGGLLLGSVSTKVLHLVHVPVTLIK